MRNERSNHKRTCNLSPTFWEELSNRGFKKEYDEMTYPEMLGYLIKASDRTTNTIYVVQSDDAKETYNIIGPQEFMKTVHQIESIVKYQLFK